MSEEYGNDFVTLIDEDGNEVEFEHIDTVEYNGVTYLAFIPAEISIEEDAEVVIMQIVEENGEELLEAVEDDEIADAVFNIVMERAEAEEEQFSGREHKVRVNSAASLSEAKHFISVRSCPVRQQSFFNPHF